MPKNKLGTGLAGQAEKSLYERRSRIESMVNEAVAPANIKPEKRGKKKKPKKKKKYKGTVDPDEIRRLLKKQMGE